MPRALREGRKGLNELRASMESRSARIAVIGCGYVGLPLSLAYARAGFRVVGIDVDPRKVEMLRRSESYVQDVGSDALREQTSAGRLTATTDHDVLRECDVIFVAVPTPFDRAKQPDLAYITAAADQIAARLRPGQLVILESTTYPGTTDEILRPILERSGLKAGRDFYLAFSPERIDPGNRTYGIENTPKVVGGVDPGSTAIAKFVLEQVVVKGSVHPMSSARAAELTKLLENIFRAVNIALVNELALLCDRMGLDVWEVIEAASTKPYGFMPFYPGPGVGGHCIPVDPYYLSWKAREYDFHTKFIELAAETNLAMPFFAVSRIRRILDEGGLPLRGSRVLVIGASFKPDIDDARNSAAVRVMEILCGEGARVDYHDPHVAEIRISSTVFSAGGAPIQLRSVPLDRETVSRADCVAILVRHGAIDVSLVAEHAKRVFDAVNALAGTTSRGVVERL